MGKTARISTTRGRPRCTTRGRPRIGHDRDLEFYLGPGAGVRRADPGIGVRDGTRSAAAGAAPGYEVMGVDLSPHMLEVADRKLAAERPEVRARVRWCKTTWRASTWAAVRAHPHPVALLPVPAHAAHQRRCLEACARHMRAGGAVGAGCVQPSIFRAWWPAARRIRLRIRRTGGRTTPDTAAVWNMTSGSRCCTTRSGRSG